MKAKEYLLQIQDMRTKIENKRERLERIANILMSPAVGELKDDKVQTSIKPDKQENMIAQKQSLEDELHSLMYKEAALLIKIGKQIDGMENPIYSRILHLRYEEQISLRGVCDKLGYSYEYVRRLHGQALQAFEQKYKGVGIKTGIDIESFKHT